MKRLLTVEREKADKRKKGGVALPKNSSEGDSRDIVAKEFGVSNDTMKKEIAIADNRDLLDPSDFADWDEGKHIQTPRAAISAAFIGSLRVYCLNQ